MTMGLSVQKRTYGQIVSFPRAWASSTPPTCAVLDGRAPNAKLGQPGRLLSGVGGRAGQNFLKSVGRTQGSFSWGHIQVSWNWKQTKAGATDCNRVQWIAPRRSRSAPLAASGRKRPPRIGHTTRAYSPAWRNTGSQAIEFQTRGAWRSFVCSHNPHPAPTPITAGHPTRKGTLTD
jgi:hypothetical protein